MTYSIRAQSISKTIRGTTLLNNVTFECGSGEAVALIGPNGAGKTLLLKALSLVDPPTTGILSIEDVQYRFPDANSANQPPPWPKLTFVFQQLFLWPHLTLRENIVLPVSTLGRDTPEVNAELHRLADEAGISTILDRYPNQVSGGQRQRAAIVRALILKPQWLLLDEPNSALDVEQSGMLQKLILAMKAEGVGVIFSTHLLGFAASVADRVVFLDQGEIVEQGKPEILLHPKTERMLRFVSMVEHGQLLRDIVTK